MFTLTAQTKKPPRPKSQGGYLFRISGVGLTTTRYLCTTCFGIGNGLRRIDRKPQKESW